MKTVVILVCGILMLGSAGPAMALDLPPDVRADQYLLEATEALEQGDPKTAIRAFEKIEALDTEPPMEFLFFYGKLLVENSPAVDGGRKGHAFAQTICHQCRKGLRTLSADPETAVGGREKNRGSRAAANRSSQTGSRSKTASRSKTTGRGS